MRTGKDLLILTAMSACLVRSSVGTAQRANAASLTGQYFKVAENTSDFQQGVDYGTVTGLVQSTQQLVTSPNFDSSVHTAAG